MTNTVTAPLPTCRHCGQPAIVGIGQPAGPIEWLCGDAWNERLAAIRSQLDELKRLLLGGADG